MLRAVHRAMLLLPEAGEEVSLCGGGLSELGPSVGARPFPRRPLARIALLVMHDAAGSEGGQGEDKDEAGKRVSGVLRDVGEGHVGADGCRCARVESYVGVEYVHDVGRGSIM